MYPRCGNPRASPWPLPDRPLGGILSEIPWPKPGLASKDRPSMKASLATTYTAQLWKPTSGTKTLRDRGGVMKLKTLILIALLLLSPYAAPAAVAATTSMRLLYPSFAGSWATAWIPKEAGYFTAEGLDIELVRVGGSTRMVAAL